MRGFASDPERDAPLDIALSVRSFDVPEYVDPESAWLEHGPFAFWLVDALRPRTVVELGTHGGYSYFAFCQAIATLGLDAQAFAVDHWLGDAHTGEYGEEVFARVSRVHEMRFRRFSTLVRSDFDSARARFADGSVDLLHVDGQHFYEDVRHDFDLWVSALSARGVVLFHDTRETHSGFGVGRLWGELAARYPSFEFHHGHGLGVLGVGSEQSERMTRWFQAMKNPAAAATVRAAYERLGGAVQISSDLDRARETEARRVAEAERVAAEAIRESTRYRRLVHRALAATELIATGRFGLLRDAVRDLRNRSRAESESGQGREAQE